MGRHELRYFNQPAIRAIAKAGERAGCRRSFSASSRVMRSGRPRLRSRAQTEAQRSDPEGSTRSCGARNPKHGAALGSSPKADPRRKHTSAWAPPWPCRFSMPSARSGSEPHAAPSRRCTGWPAATTRGATKHLFAPGAGFTLVPNNPFASSRSFREHMTMAGRTNIKMRRRSSAEISSNRFRSSASDPVASEKRSSARTSAAGTSLNTMYTKRSGRRRQCRRCSSASSRPGRRLHLQLLCAYTDTDALGIVGPNRCR